MRKEGKRFAEKLEKARIQNKHLPKFRWPTVNKMGLNRHLLPVLKAMTQDHCTYCDAFPVEGVSHETIDHFRPKSKYPKSCCVWSNLYYACDCCQGHKAEHYETALLRPDAKDYSFDAYFLYDHASGRIEVNPQASLVDQHRAAYSITIFGLNASDRPASRRRMADRFRRTESPELDIWPYRFVLE